MSGEGWRFSSSKPERATGLVYEPFAGFGLRRFEAADAAKSDLRTKGLLLQPSRKRVQR